MQERGEFMAEKPEAITGTGTINDPYIVHNYNEIKWVCEDETAIPEGQTVKMFVYMKLNNNIDCQDYDEDFEWSIECQHAVDINLNNKTIKTFYIVSRAYLFTIPNNVGNFNMHDGAILNIYGNWFDPSSGVFSYERSADTDMFSITNVSMSINVSQFTDTNIIISGPTSVSPYVTFTNCAITLEGTLQGTPYCLFSYTGLYTCDFMLNITPRHSSFSCIRSSSVLQDCRAQGVIDYSLITTNNATISFASLSVARNCVFDLQMILPAVITTEKQFLYNTATSPYNYGIYNRNKLPDLITFSNTDYIECTTQDMDMRVNPHADTTLQEKGFEVIKG